MNKKNERIQGFLRIDGTRNAICVLKDGEILVRGFADKMAGLKLNDKVISSAKLKHTAPLEVSCLHLQTLARESDFDGAFIRKLKKREL